jgi:hypothetical protein
VEGPVAFFSEAVFAPSKNLVKRNLLQQHLIEQLVDSAVRFADGCTMVWRAG